MLLDDELPKEIIERITSVSEPRKVILFGSAAIGELTPDSDIDLLIISDETENLRNKRTTIARNLCGLGHSFDVILISTEWFEESKNVVGGIAYPANKYGKVLYEAA